MTPANYMRLLSFSFMLAGGALMPEGPWWQMFGAALLIACGVGCIPQKGE